MWRRRPTPPSEPPAEHAVALTPEARDELRRATSWYAERSPTAAALFVEAYKLARSRISELPTAWPELEPGIRRVSFRRFPYGLLYTIEPDHILVLAVMHQKRQPGYWRGR
ncbi:MAG: type II toxin-antitoxin system RelE/ParE family toxin [Myxococcota bacterium]